MSNENKATVLCAEDYKGNVLMHDYAFMDATNLVIGEAMCKWIYTIQNLISINGMRFYTIIIDQSVLSTIHKECSHNSYDPDLEGVLLTPDQAKFYNIKEHEHYHYKPVDQDDAYYAKVEASIEDAEERRNELTELLNKAMKVIDGQFFAPEVRMRDYEGFIKLIYEYFENDYGINLGEREA